MTQWVKGLILALFLASYPATYFLGSHNMDKKWTEKYTTLVTQYNLTMEGVRKVNEAKDEGFNQQIQLLTTTANKENEQFKKRIAELERSAHNSLLQSSSRADFYRKQARASEAERNNLAEHTARLDQSLVEGKAVARELRLTLEQRDEELRNLGVVLKAIEKKYE